MSGWRSALILATCTMPFTAVSPAWAQQWVHCANQGEQCDIDGVGIMRYGSDERWHYQVGTDTHLCDHIRFGDPSPGVPKTCQRWEVPDETARNAGIQALQTQLQQTQQQLGQTQQQLGVFEEQERYVADLEEELGAVRRELRQLRRARRRD